MNGMMLHCGSETVTRTMVENVPVPDATRSYKPVSYGAAIEFVHAEAQRQLGMSVVKEQYGLNKAGDQMFALLTLDSGRESDGLTIGLRQSYNKSLALGIAAGSQVFVCDNLCFSGNAFKVVRKNTVNVWEDFTGLVTEQIGGSLGHYKQMTAECDAMKEIGCDTERGYAVLGVMQGRGLLLPNQASVAFGDWRKPRHEEFDRRDVWGLYNAVTEGLKKGAPARTMERHSEAHDFFTSELLPPVLVTPELAVLPSGALN